MATGKDEIKSILDNLIAVLGLPEEQSWQDLINAAKKNHLDCIKLAIGKMKLPCEMKFPIKIRLLKASTLPDAHAEAMIEIPENLPLYRVDEWKNLVVDVTVRTDCFQDPQRFVTVILHELAHLYLKIVGSGLYKNEKAVDLVSILLGFSEMICIERKQSKTYGYLSDEEFNVAVDYINHIRIDDAKSKLFDDLSNFETSLQNIKILMDGTMDRLDNLHKRTPKMSLQDATRLKRLYGTEGVSKIELNFARLKHVCDRVTRDVSVWDSPQLATTSMIRTSTQLISNAKYEAEKLIVNLALEICFLDSIAEDFEKKVA
jgi:hypothetical protein